MNTRNKALLEEAKQQGYLVMRYGYSRDVVSQYYQWCHAQVIPAIFVWFHGSSASFDSNTEPVFVGSAMDGRSLFCAPDFTPTSELLERCRALSKRCLASVSRGNYGRARTLLCGELAAYYIGQEMAIEAAKELWDIWQEAKQHLVFIPD